MHLLIAAFKNRLARLGRKLAPRGVHIEPHRLPQPGHHAGEVLRTLPHRPRRHRTVGQGSILIGHDEFGVDLLADTQAAALRTGAVGRVERERPRLEVIYCEWVSIRAGQFFGEPLFAVRVMFVAVDEIQHHDAVGQT